jgi:hypothetical protein
VELELGNFLKEPYYLVAKPSLTLPKQQERMKVLNFQFLNKNN